jgi:AcrR family transcriptional regulator
MCGRPEEDPLAASRPKPKAPAARATKGTTTKGKAGSTAPKTTDGANGQEGPRRSALLHARARRTREQLIRAALRIWNERGFERGIEETTVDEIARAANVTKGTFYFHFAHKEDILLELGWGTAAAMFDEATKSIADGLSLERAVDRLMTSLARRVEQAPKAAVARSVAEFHRLPRTTTPPRQIFGFRQAFAAIFAHARESGEIAANLDAADLGRMLEAVTMDAIVAWATGGGGNLRQTLRRRAALLVAGFRAGVPV